MQFPKLEPNSVYISPLAIEALWNGLQKGAPVLNISPDGSFTLTLSGLDKPPNAEIEFVERGIYKQALAYDMGRLHTEQKNAVEIAQAQQQLEWFKERVQNRIDEVRASPPPTIPVAGQEKIDNILKKLDVINFRPQLASFGAFCSKERELLDRCYLGNPQDTIVCHDYAASFQKCVYANPSAQQEQQQQQQQNQ